MALLRLSEFSPHAPLLPRVIAAVALIAGLLGMHVLMAPSSHAAHARADVAEFVVSSVSATSQPHHGAAAAPSASLLSAANPALDQLPCASVCADPASQESSHGQDESIWSVICVLALLLTALLLMPPGRSRVLSRRGPWPAVRQTDADGSSAPQHPPSLHLLSISRT
jgi:hypothetical protein